MRNILLKKRCKGEASAYQCSIPKKIDFEDMLAMWR